MDDGVENPVEVATRSLRADAENANLSPALFSWMSAAVENANREGLRDAVRRAIKSAGRTFAAGVDTWQKQRLVKTTSTDDLVNRPALACRANRDTLRHNIDQKGPETCVERLLHTRKVAVAGVLGSARIADCLVYNATLISDCWPMKNTPEDRSAAVLRGCRLRIF